MSGTTMSTPSNSASGNINPASMTMMSSAQRMAMQFMPNSPSPPSGMTCSLPLDIDSDDASTAWDEELRGGAPAKQGIPYTGVSMSSGGNSDKSFLRRGLESGLRNAFMKAYDTVKVDPKN